MAKMELPTTWVYEGDPRLEWHRVFRWWPKFRWMERRLVAGWYCPGVRPFMNYYGAYWEYR